jgi:hypothetical protein
MIGVIFSIITEEYAAEKCSEHRKRHPGEGCLFYFAKGFMLSVIDSGGFLPAVYIAENPAGEIPARTFSLIQKRAEYIKIPGIIRSQERCGFIDRAAEIIV